MRSHFIAVSLLWGLFFSVQSLAQDGLADEIVSLNTIDSAQTGLQHKIRYDESHRPYNPPVLLDDGLLVGNLMSAAIDASKIEQLRRRIGRGEYGYIDSLLIHHNGQLIVEEYWGIGVINKPHFVFSITKNILSNAIGKAIELGLIGGVNDSVLTYFPELSEKELAPGIGKIRIHDLLTMHSGLSLEGMGINPDSINKTNHVEHYLTLTRPVSPGKHFKYQGADPDILNHILYRVSGLTLKEFTEKHFFKPLGIDNVRWEPSVCGLIKASSGLHLTSRDMMKIGMMTMHYGRFQGEQLLNREWMEAATSPQTGNGKYGYFWWTEDFRVDSNLVQTISGRGARGQFIFMMPQLELVVVVTSRNDNKTRRAPFVFVPELILPAFL